MTTEDNSLADYEATSLDDLLQRPVAFHRAFLKFGAGITGALMLSQAFYWSSKTRESGYWFYKTREEWEEETGLSRYEQEGARKRLIKFGVLEEDKRGIPCKLYYRVNRRVLTDVLLGEIPQSSRRDGHKLSGVKPNPQSGRKKKPKPDGGNSPSQPVEASQAITESTQETTSQTTALLPTTEVVSDQVLVVDGELLTPEESAAIDAQIEEDEQRSRRPADMPGPKDPKLKTYKAWIAYAWRYKQCYGDYPLWNAKTASLISHLVDRVGVEHAHHVAETYLRLKNSLYVKRFHPVELLLQDCQAIYMQWKTNTSMTDEKARQIDKTQTNVSTADEVEAAIRARYAAREANANA